MLRARRVRATLPYDEWLRRRMCGRKQRWDSEMLARNWLFLLTLRFGPDVAVLAPYECPYCEGWHLGHQRLAVGDPASPITDYARHPKVTPLHR